MTARLPFLNLVVGILVTCATTTAQSVTFEVASLKEHRDALTFSAVQPMPGGRLEATAEADVVIVS